MANCASAWLRSGPRRSTIGPKSQRLAEELDRARSARCDDREHPLYRQYPEAWLESQARAQIETHRRLAARATPIYGQVPAFAGGERGILDLLAVDYTGRLAVVELKASADLHLPLQALDYWIRVKWHLDRGEFRSCGYFPGVELRPEPPRLLLVSPSLEFHPTTETILDYFSPEIDVERIGLGLEWRKGLQVVFRLMGAQRPFRLKCQPYAQTLQAGSHRSHASEPGRSAEAIAPIRSLRPGGHRRRGLCERWRTF